MNKHVSLADNTDVSSNMAAVRATRKRKREVLQELAHNARKNKVQKTKNPVAPIITVSEPIAQENFNGESDIDEVPYGDKESTSMKPSTPLRKRFSGWRAVNQVFSSCGNSVSPRASETKVREESNNLQKRTTTPSASPPAELILATNVTEASVLENDGDRSQPITGVMELQEQGTLPSIDDRAPSEPRAPILPVPSPPENCMIVEEIRMTASPVRFSDACYEKESANAKDCVQKSLPPTPSELTSSVPQDGQKNAAMDIYERLINHAHKQDLQEALRRNSELNSEAHDSNVKIRDLEDRNKTLCRILDGREKAEERRAAAALKPKEKELAKKEKDLEQREQALAAKVEDIARREQAVAGVEKDSEAALLWEKAMKAKEEKNARRDEACIAREMVLSEREIALKQWEEEAKAEGHKLQGIVGAKENAVAVRLQEAIAKDLKVASKQAELDGREILLKSIDQELVHRRKQVAQNARSGQEAKLAAEVQREKTNLATIQAEKESLLDKIRILERFIATKPNEQQESSDDNVSTDVDLVTRTQAITEKEQEVIAKEQTVTLKEESMTAKEQEIIKREQAVAAREQVVFRGIRTITSEMETTARRYAEVQNFTNAKHREQQTVMKLQAKIAQLENALAGGHQTVVALQSKTQRLENAPSTNGFRVLLEQINALRAQLSQCVSRNKSLEQCLGILVKDSPITHIANVASEPVAALPLEQNGLPSSPRGLLMQTHSLSPQASHLAQPSARASLPHIPAHSVYRGHPSAPPIESSRPASCGSPKIPTSLLGQNDTSVVNQSPSQVWDLERNCWGNSPQVDPASRSLASENIQHNDGYQDVAHVSRAGSEKSSGFKRGQWSPSQTVS